MEKHHIAIIPVIFVNYDLPDMADDCLLVCMPLCNSLGKSEPPPQTRTFVWREVCQVLAAYGWLGVCRESAKIMQHSGLMACLVIKCAVQITAGHIPKVGLHLRECTTSASVVVHLRNF